MPLKPALAAFHPRKPEPKSRRGVSCPYCAHRFEISRRAISVRCPRCTRPLQFEDLTLRGRVEGDVATMGEVELSGPSSELVGRLVCTTLTSHGRYEGAATVYGRARLGPDSQTLGTLTSRAIVVERGATLRATVRVHPKPDVRGIRQAVSGRQARRLGKAGTFTRTPAFTPIT